MLTYGTTSDMSIYSGATTETRKMRRDQWQGWVERRGAGKDDVKGNPAKHKRGRRRIQKSREWKQMTIRVSGKSL